MIKIVRKTNFIEKANKQHDCYYKYDKFVYINAKTKGIIICPKHGEFEQSPDKHLNTIYPCPNCLAEHRSRVMQNRRNEGDLRTNVRPFSYFIKKAERKFGKNKFDYNEESYSGMMNDMKITCKIHGEFIKTPHNFLISSCGCSECGSDSKISSKTKNYEDFIEKAKKIHGNKYSYPIENNEAYKNRKSVISIICDKHGEFKKTAQKHLSGQGCFLCNVEKLIDEGILVGGYNEELFKNNEELRNEKGVLYYLSINNGECYKIGITKNSALDRANALKWKSNGDIQDIQVLNEYEDTLENVYNYEQCILKEFAYIRTYRHYSTELLKKDIRDKELFKSIFN